MFFMQELYEPNMKGLIAGMAGNAWGNTFDWGAIMGTGTVNERVESARPVVEAALEETNK
jgi:hypothetical protein